MDNISADFKGNSASTRGGAINNFDGAKITKISDNTFEGNTANMTSITTGGGGAIGNDSDGEIGEIVNSVFKGNSGIVGGAILNESTINSITGSEFLNNTATNTASLGGAIYNTGTITEILDTSFSTNSAVHSGGAIYNGGTITTIGDSVKSIVFNGNSTSRDVTPGGGGAIANWNGFINKIFIEADGNIASAQGGAIFNSAVTTNGVYGESIINSITGIFTNNKAHLGGAIASRSDNKNSYVSHDNPSQDSAYVGTISGTFISNSANAKGGAIHNNYSVADTIAGGSTFKDNEAVNAGGAISLDTATLYNIGSVGSPVEFIGNKHTKGTGSTNGGGAIYNENGYIGSIIASFTSNTSVNRGGAIYNYGAKSKIDKIIDSTFTSNSAVADNTAAYGGAIAVASASSSINEINNSTFDGNYVSGSDARGGAIYVSSGTIGEFVNTSFTNNYASGTSAYGGAIYADTNLNITADGAGKKSEFKGNKVVVNGVEDNQAIYIANNNSVLTLNAINGGEIIFGDKIKGNSKVSVMVTGDTNSSIILKDAIEGFSKVTLENVNLGLGENTLANATFFTTNGTLDLTWDNVVSNPVNINKFSANSTADLKLNIDTDNETIDSLKFISSTGTQTHTLTIKELEGLPTNISSKVVEYKVLDKAKTGDKIYLELDDKFNSAPYKKVYSIDEYIVDGAYKVYSDQFVGTIGIRLNDARDTLILGSLDGNTSLYAVNKFDSGSMDRYYIFKNPTDVEVINNNLGTSGGGNFYVQGATPVGDNYSTIDFNEKTGFDILDDKKFEISNLKIINSKYTPATSSAPALGGSALYIGSSGAEVLVKDSIFQDNKTSGNGGAIKNAGEKDDGGYIGGKLTIDNVKFINNEADDRAGTLRVAGGTTIVKNTLFKGGYAPNNAGAIATPGSADWTTPISLTVENTVFELNHNDYTMSYEEAIAHGGGAISFGINAVATFDDVTFKDNYSTRGGAIQNNFSNVTIKNSKFLNNYANLRGGAIIDIPQHNVNGGLSISNTEFTGNYIDKKFDISEGGAIYLNPTSSTLGTGVLISDSTFKQNIADDGGAIFVNNSANKVVINGSTFEANKAERGGAIQALNGSTERVYVENSTFKENDAPLGSAIYTVSSGQIDIGNDVIFDANKGENYIYNDGKIHFYNSNPLTLDNNKSGTTNAVIANNGSILINNENHNLMTISGDVTVTFKDDIVFDTVNKTTNTSIITLEDKTNPAVGNIIANFEGSVSDQDSIKLLKNATINILGDTVKEFTNNNIIIKTGTVNLTDRNMTNGSIMFGQSGGNASSAVMNVLHTAIDNTLEISASLKSFNNGWGIVNFTGKGEGANTSVTLSGNDYSTFSGKVNLTDKERVVFRKTESNKFFKNTAKINVQDNSTFAYSTSEANAIINNALSNANVTLDNSTFEISGCGKNASEIYLYSNWLSNTTKNTSNNLVLNDATYYMESAFTDKLKNSNITFNNTSFGVGTDFSNKIDILTPASTPGNPVWATLYNFSGGTVTFADPTNPKDIVSVTGGVNNTFNFNNSMLDLSKQQDINTPTFAGDFYVFDTLNMNNSTLGLDVNLLLIQNDGVVLRAPYSDKIWSNNSTGQIVDVTKLFITDDNGKFLRESTINPLTGDYDVIYRTLANGDSAPTKGVIQVLFGGDETTNKLQLAANNNIELLTWATNIYKYGVITAQTEREADSLEILGLGNSSNDTLRDLNMYESIHGRHTRGFNFIPTSPSGHYENSYNLYRDLDTTAEGTFTVLGSIYEGSEAGLPDNLFDDDGNLIRKSILDGTLKNLELTNESLTTRIQLKDGHVIYYEPNLKDYSIIDDYVHIYKGGVEVALSDLNDTDVYDRIVIDKRAYSSEGKDNGSFFELVGTSTINLDVEDILIRNATRYDEPIKDGSVIYSDNPNATITFKNVDLYNNSVTTGNGGAIANILSKELTITNAVIKGNSASGNGGAIYNTSTGKTELTNIIAYNNKATDSTSLGGAIYTSTNMLITDSNFGRNANGDVKLNYHKNNIQNDIYIDSTAKVEFATSDGIENYINSGIAGSADSEFIKTGTGTLNMTGINKDYLGTLSVTAGDLVYTKTTSDDSFVGGDIKIAQDSKLSMNIDGSSLVEEIKNIKEYTDPITNVVSSGTLEKIGAGQLILGGNSSDFKGNVDINEGKLTYKAENSTDSYINQLGVTTVKDGATFELDIADIENQVISNVKSFTQSEASTAKITKIGAGEVDLIGDNSEFYGSVTIDDGTFHYDIQNATDEYITGNTIINNPGNFKVSVLSTIEDKTIGNISGDGKFIVANQYSNSANQGKITLVGTNDNFNGTTEIQSGILSYTAGVGTFVQGQVDIQQKGTLEYLVNSSDTSDLTAIIKGNGDFDKSGAGILNINGGDNSLFTGDLNVIEGNLVYNKTADTDKFVGGSNHIAQNAKLTMNIDSNLSDNIQNVTSYTDQTTNVVSSGTLEKTGTGQLILGGNNSDFKGNVDINEGKLTYKAENSTDSYINQLGVTTVKDGANFELDIADIENQVITNVKSFTQSEASTAKITKIGTGEVDLIGDNSEFYGSVNIDNGTFHYDIQNATDEYITGNTIINNPGNFKVSVLSTIENKTIGNISGDGKFSVVNEYIDEETQGKITLVGTNDNFNGTTEIQSGILSYTAGVGTFVQGQVDIQQEGTLEYIVNSSDTSDLTASIKGNGIFDKLGTGTLNINGGDNSSFTGDLNIIAGDFVYNKTADTDKFVGGSINIASNAKLIMNIDSGLSDSIQSITGYTASNGSTTYGTLEKAGLGNLSLEGDNSNFNGNLNIKNGTVLFDNATDKYINGNTSVDSGAFLNYTTTSDATLGKVAGSGTINKSGDAVMTFNASNNSDFNGTVNIQSGQLNTKGKSKNDFDYSINIIDNSILNYTAASGANITLDENSKVKFVNNTPGTTATAIFNDGTYKLDAELENSSGNKVAFNNANVVLADSAKYTDVSYETNNSLIDLTVDSGAVSNRQISNLNTTNTGIAIDVNLLLPNPTYDTLTVGNNNSSNISVDLSQLKVADTKTDDGLGATYTLNVLDGITFDSDKSINNWATTVYLYGVQTQGSNVIMTALSAADDNSLKVINQMTGNRGFNFTDNDNIPYTIAESLGETGEGKAVILGNDSGTTVISGSNTNSFFEVVNDTDLTVKDIVIQDASGTEGSVVKADNANANIALNNVSIKSSSSSGNGGAINNTNSENFTITGGTISDNSSSADGGAIYNASTGTTDITSAIISGNTSTGNGGAIYNVTAGNTTINSTDITNNTSLGDGGAIYNASTGATDITSAVISGNTSTGNGGAIYNAISSDITITSSTIENNTSSGLGGAIYTEGNLTITDTNFSGNTDSNGANDIYLATGSIVDYIANVDSSVSDGIAGSGTFNKQGGSNLLLSGSNEGFTGTLNVVSGDLLFNQNSSTDSYILGTTNIDSNSTVTINNSYSNITAGEFTGNGTIIKEGAKSLALTGDNSGFKGLLNITEGAVAVNTDNTKYISGKTSISDGAKLAISNDKETSLSNISGLGTVSKTGSGKLKLYGDITEFTGSLTITEGELAFANDINMGQFASGSFADGSGLNLQNTVAIQDSEGNWSTLPNPTSIQSVKFDKLTLNGNVGLKLDIDLLNTIADNVSANSVNGTGHFVLGEKSLNVVSDTLVKNTNVQIAGGALADDGWIILSDSAKTVMGPIQKYDVEYNNGFLGFTRHGGNRPDINSVNPAIMVSPVATQIAGYLTQTQTLHDGFYHMDRYSKYSGANRLAALYENTYAIDGTPVYSRPTNPEISQGMWIKPYTTFEKVQLKGGIDVSNVAYGSLYGGDSDLVRLKNGYYGVLSTYIGYNGSHQSFNGISMNHQGGTLGVTGTLYKGNFFTGLTMSTGASAGEAYTPYGTDNFALLTAGIANKTGYNLEFKEGKFIVQPSLFLGYTFVNNFDYTNSAGVKIDSDSLHAIQIAPGVKFIGNLSNGWQPYVGVDMVWNAIDKTNVMANDVKLPQLSVKPYVQYEVGVQKTWGERFTAFFQTMIRNGGRNGIILTGGFRWLFGKESSDNNKNVSDKKPVKIKTLKNKN